MVRAVIDPRLGGCFFCTDRRAGEYVEHTGEHLEIDRSRRLVFTIAVTGGGEKPDIMRIDIAPHSDGCELTLQHEMATGYSENLERTQQGWATIVGDLATTLSRVSEQQR